jgi:murein DD-endopeptidase MepM/ murein hydrolase activator NlpD
MRPLPVLLCAAALIARVEVAHGRSADGVVWPGPLEVQQGEVVEVKMRGENLAAVEGQIGNEKIYFYPNGPVTFTAIVGADVEARPGPSKLLLKAISSTGAESYREVAFRIKSKSFRKESFNVPPTYDQMSPETLEEIRRERAAFARVFATPSPDRIWDGQFVRPVPHEASASSFGFRRIINGKPRAPHTGTDLSAPVGTEVVAANHGRVVLVGNFFFAGGSIVLDHGGGLFTMYFHLSEFRVEEGVMVKKGEVVALSGATGRVTGPHLHWGARILNARVDPLQLLKKISHSSYNVQEPKPPARKMEKEHDTKRS